MKKCHKLWFHLCFVVHCKYPIRTQYNHYYSVSEMCSSKQINIAFRFRSFSLLSPHYNHLCMFLFACRPASSAFSLLTSLVPLFHLWNWIKNYFNFFLLRSRKQGRKKVPYTLLLFQLRSSFVTFGTNFATF